MRTILQTTIRHVLLAFGAVLALAQGAAWAQSTGDTIDMADASPPAAGTNWTYASNTYTVTGDVTIKGTTGDGTASNGRRVVAKAASPAMTITLDNATIDVSATGLACAFDMTGATVTLVLAAGSSNTLKSGSYRPGVRAPAGATLTIRSDPANPGSLTAASVDSGGDGGAGIGGAIGQNGGTISIESGTITATGDGGAGIGSGFNNSLFGGSGGNITISGGTVIAVGLYGGAGIGGGGYSQGGNITITGTASVTATGGGGFCSYCGGGAGIGSGGDNTFPFSTTPRAAGTIKIDTRGTVTATGGSGVATGGNGANIGQGSYQGSDGVGLASFTHPAAASVAVGGNATFTCAAATMTGTGGATLAWNWRLGGVSLAPPVTTASLTLNGVTAAMDGNPYNCVLSVTNLTNDPNSSITYTSHPALLTVKSAAPAAAAAVPTLGEWALALLALTLAMLAVRRNP